MDNFILNRSILDTDLYKFTTSYAYMKIFPDAECTFTFTDRNNKTRNNYFKEHFEKRLFDACNVQLNSDEYEWCVNNIPFIPQYYWEWLKSFNFERDKIKVSYDENDILHVEVTDKCYKCTLYEIIILYCVTEAESMDPYPAKNVNWNSARKAIRNKLAFANENKIIFSEFGTRRRFNYKVQEFIINQIKEWSDTCVGTSNVYFAMKYNMKPIGTHPHEWFMFHGAQFGYPHANYLALENWTNVYDGDLGIALTDTFTTDVFFKDFSLKHSKLFDGVRQDSGDEFKFVDKTIEHYKSKGIDPSTKTIVFSNSLNFQKAKTITDYCKEKGIKASFGIGTNLTNDVGFEPENIVMKMSKCRMMSDKPWYNCVKLSDDLEKATGKNVELVKEILNIQ